MYRGDNSVDTQKVGNSLGVAGENQPIAAPKAFFRGHRRHHAAIPLDLDEVQPLQLTQPGLSDTLAHQRPIEGNRHLQCELPHGTEFLLILTVRQRPWQDQKHDGDANNSNRQSDSSDGKDRETALPCQLLILAVDHQVGAGANQRQSTPQNGGVTQGNHQLRGRYADLAGPGMDRRNHGGHYRGIVEEATQQRDRERDTGLRRAHRARRPEEVVDNQVHPTGMVNARRDHEHGNHRDQPTVTESGKGLIGADNTAGTENDEYAQHDKMRAETPYTHQ